MSEIELAPVGFIIPYNGGRYMVCNSQIEQGDLVWCEFNLTVHQCIGVNEYGLFIQLSKGEISVFPKNMFQKLIKF